MTDLTKLKELAERATPGPWSCNRHWAIVGGPILEFTNGAAQQQIAMACGQSWMHDEELRNNAEWIAAANPAAVLELIAEVERLRTRLEIDERTPYDGIACRDETIKGLDEKCDRLKRQVDMLINQHMPREPIPDMPGWSRVVDAERLVAENEVLRSALQAVQGEVDGNIRPLTRDLVNMVSGVKNSSHPNDIYEHCDEIDRIIDAALEGDGR
ncbi:ead/Ea22-like family protein [Pseudomonas aeruginosa]|uniref:ead/Ea22-like family protein n=1 Tax=Pseudomonas aeruginosa TaxID=287 RepID=UPI0021E2C3FD|nr:ead/Ea22-like family protein [Pseudomonas aeruginosa]MCV0061493.1 ead/Ea22-like family protein [Pseudomonas aeruginosa]